MESRRLIVSEDGKVTVVATSTVFAKPNQVTQQSIKLETQQQSGLSRVSGSASAQVSIDG